MSVCLFASPMLLDIVWQSTSKNFIKTEHHCCLTIWTPLPKIPVLGFIGIYFWSTLFCNRYYLLKGSIVIALSSLSNQHLFLLIIIDCVLILSFMSFSVLWRVLPLQCQCYFLYHWITFDSTIFFIFLF